MTKFKIKSGDTVQVITGDHKGSEGKVLKVLTDKSKAIVDGVNMVKKHTKPSAQNPQGGIVEKEAPIHISNVMIVCNKCADPTRMGMRQLEDGSKVRICKKCKEPMDG